jgi:hypothetical protein
MTLNLSPFASPDKEVVQKGADILPERLIRKAGDISSRLYPHFMQISLIHLNDMSHPFGIFIRTGGQKSIHSVPNDIHLWATRVVSDNNHPAGHQFDDTDAEVLVPHAVNSGVCLTKYIHAINIQLGFKIANRLLFHTSVRSGCQMEVHVLMSLSYLLHQIRQLVELYVYPELHLQPE